MFGLPKIEDVSKKTDEALRPLISKIGSAITEASALGESSVLIPEEDIPATSVPRIMKEIGKAGYRACITTSGGLIIVW